jgi:dCTP deaminase
MTATTAGPLYTEVLFPEYAAELASHTTGIYPSQKIEEFIAAGYIAASTPITADQIQPASIDLRLGSVAYRVRASFLPGRTSTVLKKAAEYSTHELDLSRPTVMERGCVYIVPLQEAWNLPPQVAGKANPKSSIGRVDVFTRLITDYSNEFERVAPGYKGKLFVEIVPRTFSILVKEGTRMNQLRFIRGAQTPSDAKLVELHEEKALVYVEGNIGIANISAGLWVSVDLEGDSEVVAYRAKHHAPLLDLDRVDYYDPSEFWEPITRPRSKQLILNPEDLYILASRERVRVPPEFAAEMVGYDPSVGEFRLHYAGFFDPGFGYGSDDVKGARAVLEVRSHEVPFVLEDGQPVGRLVYEQLMAVPHKVYGPGIGSTYQQQDLSLSKHFKKYGPYG